LAQAILAQARVSIIVVPTVSVHEQRDHLDVSLFANSYENHALPCGLAASR